MLRWAFGKGPFRGGAAVLRAMPILLALALHLAAPGAARAAAELLDDLDAADRAALDALARYPESERVALLRAATRPELLLEVEGIQARTRAAFDALLARHDDEARELLWSLVPHPDLVAEIARGGRKSRAALEAIAARHPEEVRQAAVRAGEAYPQALARIHALHASAERDFEALIRDLPEETREALRALLRLPEALSLLLQHASLTVLLGDAFERDPEQVSEWLRERGEELAQRDREAGQELASAVAADPAAGAEFEASARDYASAGFGAPASSTTHVHVHAYPYWFGTPAWMAIHYGTYDPWYWWYPRVYWPWCGSRFGPRFRVAWAGFPSHHFLDWTLRGRGRRTPHLVRHVERHHPRFAPSRGAHVRAGRVAASAGPRLAREPQRPRSAPAPRGLRPAPHRPRPASVAASPPRPIRPEPAGRGPRLPRREAAPARDPEPRAAAPPPAEPTPSLSRVERPPEAGIGSPPRRGAWRGGSPGHSGPRVGRPTRGGGRAAAADLPRPGPRGSGRFRGR